MKIYAIRDRLIDYYMQPFAAPGDTEVKAAIARQVNTGEPSDLAQAPHHFEIWRLAQVTEDGHIREDREFLGDCSSLIRAGLRKEGGSENRPVPRATDPGEGTVEINRYGTRTNSAPPAPPEEGTPSAPSAAHPRP